MMWIYGAIGVSGSWQLDSDSQAAMQQQFDTWKIKFQTADAQMESSPHYLDDGDSFEFIAIANISQLSQIKADQIYVAVHGLNIGTIESLQFHDSAQFVIGGLSFTEQSIKTYNTNIQMVLGYGHSSWAGNGIVQASAIAWSFGDSTPTILENNLDNHI